MNSAQIIDACINQVGTDASRATVLTVLNEAYVQQVADARWFRTEDSIGTTVAGTSKYTVPATIIEAYGTTVGGYTYTPIGEGDMWRLTQATSYVRLANSGGVFSQGYDSSGNTIITLYPTPQVTGSVILLYAAVQPAALADSSGSTPITPADSHSSLIDGTAAILLARIDERPDLAGPYAQSFAMATEKIRRRKNSLLSPGPAQMQVKGIHY